MCAQPPVRAVILLILHILLLLLCACVRVCICACERVFVCAFVRVSGARLLLRYMSLLLYVRVHPILILLLPARA